MMVAFPKSLNAGTPVNWACPLNTNLQAWWQIAPGGHPSYYGGPTLRDLCLKSDGTLVGPSWYGPLSRRGGFGSLAFTAANQYVDVPNLANRVGGQTKATWCSWVLANSLANTSYIFRASLDFNLRFDGAPGRYTIAVRGSTGGFEFESGNTTATVGTWEHIAVTVDILADTVNIYKNGQLKESFTGTDLGTDFDVDGDNFFYLGSNFGNFSGYLDDARFYIGRALTGSEIATVYEGSLCGNPATQNWLSGVRYFVGSGTTATEYPYWAVDTSIRQKRRKRQLATW